MLPGPSSGDFMQMDELGFARNLVVASRLSLSCWSVNEMT